MENMLLEAIVKATGGLLLNGNKTRLIARLVTDSRSDCTDAIFVPLSGERFDGHDFIAQAIASGAAGAFISKDVSIENMPKDFILIRVADTLKAYQAAASASRMRYALPVVAITGSCGKTSTKNLLSNILANRKTVRTEKNENNEVGVPLTMLRIVGETEVAIIECGMRAKGEIAALAEIVRPTHGIITNIEPAHIGRLGSLEAIADAKGELLEALGPGNFAFLNADNPLTPRLIKKANVTITTFGIEAGDVRASEIQYSLDGVRFTLETHNGKIKVYVPLPGRGTVYNAAAAAAAAVSLGESLETVADGLATPSEEGGRMRQWRTPNGMLLIDDTYNSSPASLRFALELLGSVEWARRRTAVLGDMLELGDHSRNEHFRIGKETVAKNAGLLVTFGEEARAIAEGALEGGLPGDKCFSFSDYDELAAAAGKIFQPGDMALIKGSRGMKMERIVNLLKELK